MLFHRLGLGFAPSASNPDRRHCYVRPAALDQLLETPRALELLAEELGVSTDPAALSLVEQLEAIRGRAIHLAVTPSPFRGLSVEEIVVLAAYASRRFDHTSFKRQLLRQPSPYDLRLACEAWLKQRSVVIRDGHHLSRPRWPLVGFSSADPLCRSQFTVAVLPVLDLDALDIHLERTQYEADFAHEHYLACSPAIALGYLERQASSARPQRWDPLVLDRQLRTTGVGLLLIEPGGVLLHLPARYQARPA